MDRPVKAAEIMQRVVYATTPETPVREVAQQLVSHGISGMPVVERDGTVRGIITEADILRVQVKGENLETIQAKDLMSSETIAVDAEASIDEVKTLLIEFHILRVPVIDHGKLVGVISRTDIIKAML